MVRSSFVDAPSTPGERARRTSPHERASRGRSTTMPRSVTRAAVDLDHDVDVARCARRPRSAARARACSARSSSLLARRRRLLECRRSARARTTWSTQVGDRHALGVEREVVERRIAPVDVEVLAHARGARGVVDLDLVARERPRRRSRGAPSGASRAAPSARTPARTGCAAPARSSSVAPQPRISTLPFTARSKTSSAVKIEMVFSSAAHSRSCSPCPRGCGG